MMSSEYDYCAGQNYRKRQLVNKLKNWEIYKYRINRTQDDKAVPLPYMQAQHGDGVKQVLNNCGLDLESLAHSPEGVDSSTASLLRALSSRTDIAGPPLSTGDAGYSALHSCVVWTSEQLKTLSSMPIQLIMHDETDHPELETWKEDTELFLTLWHRWQTSGCDQTEWVEEAQPTLGISATRLLTIVSGMVLDVFDEASDDGYDQYEYRDGNEWDEEDFDHVLEADFLVTEGGPDDDESQGTDDREGFPERLLDHARKSAQAIGDLDNEELWKHFSETVVRRNNFLSDEGGQIFLHD